MNMWPVSLDCCKQKRDWYKERLNRLAGDRWKCEFYFKFHGKLLKGQGQQVPHYVPKGIILKGRSRNW